MRNRPLFLFVVILVFIIALPGCGAVSNGIKGLFASATPTPTHTATPTRTPTNTATPTATLTPAVNLNPCPLTDECPDAIPIRSLIEGDVFPGEVYSVDIPFDMPISFFTGWTTIDGATLLQNKEHITFFFYIDDHQYYLPDFTSDGVTSEGYPSMRTGISVSGWKVGEPHLFSIGFTFDEEVFDGWETFPAGYTVTHNYYVNPLALPTPTNTPLPTKTPLPAPTRVPATTTPSCKLNGEIYIKNDTGGSVTMYLYGPANFVFNLKTGSTTLSVCKGSYTYKAYGCGGSSMSGSTSDGTDHTFFCD